MPTQQIVKRLRGTTGQNGAVALPEGCFVVKTPVDGTVWVHDGATNGGFVIGTGGALPSISNLNILANISGGAAIPTGNTLTAILDAILGTSPGSVIFRTASAWVAGTVRNVPTSVTLNNTDFTVFAALSAASTITLPATPGDGQRHTIKDINFNFATNNCTIAGNGHNIVTSVSAATQVMNMNGQSWTLVYSANSSLWGVI